MNEKLIFESKLSEEEIRKNFEGIDFFGSILEGLEEALDYEKGNPRPETVVRKRDLPDIDVAIERKSLNLSQKKYAAILGVSVRTVEAWETGKSHPSGSARRLMLLIKQDNSLVTKLLSIYE